MKRAIHALIIGILAPCPLCGIHRMLTFRDEEMGIEFCNGCHEHVERADRELNLAVTTQVFPHKSDSYYQLRRPDKTEVFHD